MNKYEYKKLTPFKWFVIENFPFIEADFDAITEWQLFCKLGKEINKIIDSQNLLGNEMENISNAFISLRKIAFILRPPLLFSFFGVAFFVFGHIKKGIFKVTVHNKASLNGQFML